MAQLRQRDRRTLGDRCDLRGVDEQLLIEALWRNVGEAVSTGIGDLASGPADVLAHSGLSYVGYVDGLPIVSQLGPLRPDHRHRFVHALSDKAKAPAHPGLDPATNLGIRPLGTVSRN